MTVRERFQDRVEFTLTGWRRWAYWLAVMFTGAVIGIRYGHPELHVLPWGMELLPQAPSKAVASRGTQSLSAVALALIAAILGREAFIDMED